jgi:hypothetical protein
VIALAGQCEPFSHKLDVPPLGKTPWVAVTADDVVAVAIGMSSFPRKYEFRRVLFRSPTVKKILVYVASPAEVHRPYGSRLGPL